ncbi:hypothetical protein [Eggerthella sp. YY7918]|uniref:hypothetical protein n=1 Tax=Eggerthella sp. (strain YY7918) TaxID=502558 RepID=UPI00021718D6|nr:hypothetical protein [Eggerthella sp. YY7918]BAK45137.1 hypothetical protein EGYY_20470 [Eggerthella sp. YY7918]
MQEFFLKYIAAPLATGVLVVLITWLLNHYESRKKESESRKSVFASSVFLITKELIGASLNMKMELNRLEEKAKAKEACSFANLTTNLNCAVSAVVDLLSLKIAAPEDMKKYESLIDNAHKTIVNMQIAATKNLSNDLMLAIENLIENSSKLAETCMKDMASIDARSIMKGDYSTLSPNTLLGSNANTG